MKLSYFPGNLRLKTPVIMYLPEVARQENHSCYINIQELLKKGHSIKEILFINFEDERIADIPCSELNIIFIAVR